MKMLMLYLIKRIMYIYIIGVLGAYSCVYFFSVDNVPSGLCYMPRKCFMLIIYETHTITKMIQSYIFDQNILRYTLR